jgi:hypothetical protein
VHSADIHSADRAFGVVAAVVVAAIGGGSVLLAVEIAFAGSSGKFIDTGGATGNLFLEVALFWGHV